MAVGEKVFLIISMCLVSIRHATSTVTENDLKLELLQVNFRHGFRTPSQNEARYVNVTDPKIYGSQGFGQLTNDGKYQSYRLGQLLRKNYDKFLGDYVPEHVHAYTSWWDRSKMTLQLVLAGLYPPLLEEDKWHPTLQWRPIALVQAPKRCDALITPHQCPKYKELHQYEITRSKVYQSRIARYKDFFEYMEKITAIPFKMDPIYHPGFTYNVIIIHTLMNLPLPDWCYDEQVMNQLRQLFKYNLGAMSLTQKLKRINGGTMVRQVIENIEANRNAAKQRKIYLYSSHDLTLAAFAIAQGIEAFDGPPPFSSAIILEKYRGDDDAEYVKFLAWNGEDDKFFPVKMNECEEFCPYKKYQELVKNVIPTDEELDYFVSDE